MSLPINEITCLYMGQIRNGRWYPIQRMTWDKVDGEYQNCEICYLNGAKDLRDSYENRPLLLSNLTKKSRSVSLSDSLWSNRLPPQPVSDPHSLKLLGFDPKSSVDPIVFTARYGGYLKDDPAALFPEVLPDSQGNYNFYFRPVNTWSMSTANRPELETIAVGAKVTPIVTEEESFLLCQNQIIGKLPHYLQDLARQYPQLEIKTAQLNPGASFEYQFLCHAQLSSSLGVPFSQPKYQPITDHE